MLPSPLPLVQRSPSSLLSPWLGIRRLDRSRFHRAFSVNDPLGREETRMEVDRDKAREALRQLDQQLESLAEQETLPRKKRPAPPPFLGTARLLFTVDSVRITAIFFLASHVGCGQPRGLLFSRCAFCFRGSCCCCSTM